MTDGHTIERLTDDQQRRLIIDRENYLRLGLTTERAPRAEAEKSVAAIRLSFGRPCDKVWWFDGPATANVAVHLLANLGANLMDNLWDNLKLQSAFGGHCELYWIAYYLWPHEVLRPIHTDEQVMMLRHWLTLAKAGFWMPFENVNIICELPSEIHRRDGLLHNDLGPAVVFRDHWLHWSLSGITVDQQIVISPESQTIEQIRGDNNEERRRIRIERFGWSRYLESINAEVIDLRRNDVEGTDEGLIRGDGMTVLVCACPSTGRVYGMEVDNSVETCDAAQKWLRHFQGNCIGAS